jgi:prepilin peptidase CpaA
VVSGVMALVAGVIDVRSSRIPNVLTLWLCLSGFLFHGITRNVGGMGFSLLGAAAGLTILLWFYLIGAMSGGDVKLLAGVGAWLGAEATLLIFVVAGLASGVYSIGVMASEGRLRAAWTTLAIWALQIRTLAIHLSKGERTEKPMRMADRRWRLLPFALMLTLGIAVALACGQLGSLAAR